MKYGSFIRVNEKFQTSINLEYDLNQIDKVDCYIPTEQSVKILGDFLQSFYYDNNTQNRATVFIGPYGRGKSHLLLILTALTSLDVYAVGGGTAEEAARAQRELCGKISAVNPEVGELAKIVVESGIRTLPVIVNSNTTDINQAFIVALRDALVNTGLQDLLPETYFDAACATIGKWEASFPEAYEKLGRELRQHKRSVEDLLIGLKRYDQAAYELFCACYPSVAAGAEFNPLINMDVVKLYTSVVNALCGQTPFCGINIIFDEFSKFLEANLDKSRMLNFKIIQDMAEAATRSGRQQIHFTCVTHKEILDYSASDSFKTVEGRFRQLRFIAPSEQSYELISNAIEKAPEFEDFKREHRAEFERAISVSSMVGVFGDLSQQAFEQKLVYGCFPLSPLSAYALLKVSEKVGQNERTLFTFLAQRDANTLSAFLQNDYDTLRFLTVESIYDYFGELFKREVFNTTVHSIWAKADSAIRQVSDGDQLKILKAFAVIKIIGDEAFRCTSSHIKAALMMDDDRFARASRELLKRHILAQHGSSEYVLMTANGVDVQKNVETYVKSKLARIKTCEVLADVVDLGFVMPREYNDRFRMVRYFKNIFLEAKVFLHYQDASQLLADYPYDGLVIYIVNEGEVAAEEIEQKVRSFHGQPQIVLCMSKALFQQEELLKKYVAIQRLKADMADQMGDPHYLEEMDNLEEDIFRQIHQAVQDLYSPGSPNSYFVNCDGPFPVICRQVELNHEISRICSVCYWQTPVVNNEMVNKNVITPQIRKARALVADWILERADDNVIPCMDGFGPEVSIFKSMFVRTGLDRSIEAQDPGIRAVLGEIARFITFCEEERRNFGALYQTLTEAPFGVRKGVIPLFLAYALRQYRENAVFYYAGKEVELSSAILGGLVEAPQQYEMLLEAGTGEREAYLDRLETLFAPYQDLRTTSVNRIYRVVKSMQNWMRALPEYTKKFGSYWENGESKAVGEEVKTIRRELLRFETNSRELLFSTFRQSLSPSGDISECYAEIEGAKSFLEGHLQRCKAELRGRLIEQFAPGYRGGLSRAIQTWRDGLPAAARTHLFDSTANELLSFAGKLSGYDDEQTLDDLVYRFSSMAIEDWNDALAAQFDGEISSAIRRINEYQADGEAQGAGPCNVVINLTGRRIEKAFSEEEISPLGRTALNNLQAVFEEYNGALEPDEQLAILIQLMKDLLD